MLFSPKRLLTSLCSGLVCSALLGTLPAMADTFYVTSSQCSGPDGLYEAIQLANATPGTDIVEIDAGLAISGDCPDPPNIDDSSLQITESMTLRGNFSQFHGFNRFLDTKGRVDPIDGECPTSGQSGDNFIIVGVSPSLFMIGQRDTDNSGIEVTIEGMTVDRVSQLANVRDGAKLTLRDVTANWIYDVMYCNRSTIEAFGDADLVLERVLLDRLTNFRLGAGAISGAEGRLEIYDSKFDRSIKRYAVVWAGDADIVSSFIENSGGLRASGSGTMRVVNSLIIPTEFDPDLVYTDGFAVIGGGEIRLQASTVVYNVNECEPFNVSAECVTDYFPSTATFQARQGGTIAFEESVLHVQTLGAASSPSSTLLLEALGGSFSADANTFIQPLDWQDAAALQAITGQPALLTGSDALPVTSDPVEGLFFQYPYSVTPIVTGGAILVDKILDAGVGGANELRDPRGNTITRDILGRDRVDFGDRRSIGAVQNSVVPVLVAVISPLDPFTAALSWTAPRQAEEITAYDVCHGVGVPPDPDTIGTTCPGTLLTDFTTCEPGSPGACVTGQVPGLPGASQVWFLVRATASGTPEPWSLPATVDTAFDCSTAVPSLDTLWPPSHELVPIDVLGITDPKGGPITITINGVFQDEPVNGEGDGNTSPDATGIGTNTASVRAERAGHGNGRVYTLYFTALNDGGAQCTGTIEVGVPKARKRDALNDGTLFNSVLD
jgi:hypothetical protein